MKLAGGVDVAMDMDQVSALQQGRVPQDLCGFPFSNHTASRENITIIRDILDNTQIVCGRNHCLGSPAPTHQGIDHLACALRVKRRRGLIQEENVRVKHEHRGKCHAFLFAS